MAPLSASTGEALLCLRPHDVFLEPVTVQPANSVHATVTDVQWLGEQHSIVFDLAGQSLRLVSTPLRDPPSPGAVVEVHFAAEDASIIPDETS